MKNKKEIIVLVGNIGSGKSTLVQKYVKKGYVVVCRDSFRYMMGGGQYTFDLNLEPAVFAIETDALINFMRLGVNIIVDEVGMSKKMRKKYLALSEMYGYKAKAVVMKRLSKKVSVDRRMQNPHGQPDRDLWESVWEKFDKCYEKPTKQEGFYEIISGT